MKLKFLSSIRFPFIFDTHLYNDPIFLFLRYSKLFCFYYVFETCSDSVAGTFRELQSSGLDFTQSLGDSNQEEEPTNETELGRQLSVRSIASVEVEAPQTVEEQKSTGTIGGYVYNAYFSAGGNCCVIFIFFFLFIAAQLFSSASDYYLTYW